MIHFTDITGLAGCALAMAVLVVRLPGVSRLRRPYLALLAGMVMVSVLVPFGSLPLAAYVRGITGDLSITSLVLLMLAMLRSLSGMPPNGGLHAPPPSIPPSLGDGKQALLPPGEGLGWRKDSGRYLLLSMIALASISLYPMALGLGFFDPYRLGYGSTWFLAGLLVVALAAYFRQLPVIALTIALAVLAWSMGWYESNSLWNYLLDPLVSVYAIGALLARHFARAA